MSFNKKTIMLVFSFFAFNPLNGMHNLNDDAVARLADAGLAIILKLLFQQRMENA